MQSSQNEQLTLGLEWPVYDHYTIELRTDYKVVRSATAKTLEGAIGIIDGMRDRAVSNDDVTWRSTEVDIHGALFGLAPGGVVWEIHVTPDLNTELA